MPSHPHKHHGAGGSTWTCRRPRLRYGDIVSVIDAARGAGVTRVGIVTAKMRKGLS